MKLLVLSAFLFSTLALLAQAPGPKPPQSCSIFLRMSWTRDTGTEDESLDTVSVCEDGRAFAEHSFTAPAFGAAKPERTAWDYRNELGKETVEDIKKFLNREDVVALSKS